MPNLDISTSKLLYICTKKKTHANINQNSQLELCHLPLNNTQSHDIEKDMQDKINL
jgi:hypothetical protein